MRNLAEGADDAAATAIGRRSNQRCARRESPRLSFAESQYLTRYTQFAAARFCEFVPFTIAAFIASRQPPLAPKGRNGGQREQQSLDVELLSYRFGVGIGIKRLRRLELVGVGSCGRRPAPVTETSFLLPVEHRSPAARCCKATVVLRSVLVVCRFCGGDSLCWDRLSLGLSHRNSRGEWAVMFSGRFT